MLSVIHHRRRAAAWASAAAGLVLIGLAAAPVAEAPATPQPRLIAPQRSPSGKVLDRLPGAAPTASRLAVGAVHSDWAMALTPEPSFTAVSAAANDLDIVDKIIVDKPVRVAVAKAASPAPKPPRPLARPQATAPAIAALPPARPASLHLPRATIEITAPQERRPSVASRMIAFVGSLALLARPL
jgi:hypothetical protein